MNLGMGGLARRSNGLGGSAFVQPLGLPGATAPSRYVGATAGGPPTTGSFARGDFLVDAASGLVWVCQTAGSPGSWIDAGAMRLGAYVAPTTPITVAAGSTYLPLDVANATIVWAYGIAAFGGDNTRFEVPLTGRYLLLAGIYVSQHATDWLALSLFSDLGGGAGPTIPVPPISLFDMGGGIDVQYTDIVELVAGTDRPNFVIYSSGPDVTLNFAVCAIQYLGPRATP